MILKDKFQIIFLQFQLYSYYARSEPKDVHKILKKYKTNYIIMEDSICLTSGKNGCTLKDILDVDRGEVMAS